MSPALTPRGLEIKIELCPNMFDIRFYAHIMLYSPRLPSNEQPAQENGTEGQNRVWSAWAGCKWFTLDRTMVVM
jgi:hypothetical protein